MALPVHGACRHDQGEPSPEILYIEPQKNGLPMSEQAKLLSSRLGTGDYFKIFEGMSPPFSNKDVFTGYVLRLAA